MIGSKQHATSLLPHIYHFFLNVTTSVKTYIKQHFIMSTSYSIVANTASQASASRLIKIGLKQGQKRAYFSYLEKDHKINKHVRTLSISCMCDVTYNIQKNAKTTLLVESPMYLSLDNVSGRHRLSSIGQDTDDFLKQNNDKCSEHRRKRQRIFDKIADEEHKHVPEETRIYSEYGGYLCCRIKTLEQIREARAKKNILFPVKPSNPTRVPLQRQSTKHRVKDIGQRMANFKPSYDPRKVAPTVITKTSSAPPVTTSRTLPFATCSTAPVTVVPTPVFATPSAPIYADSQIQTGQITPATAIYTPAVAKVKELVEIEGNASDTGDEGTVDSNVDDVTDDSFLGESGANPPVETTKQDVINFHDSGIFMELPESIELNNGQAVARQSLPSSAGGRSSLASNGDGNEIQDEAVALGAVDTDVSVDSNPENGVDALKDGQNSNINNIDCPPSAVGASVSFPNYVTRLELPKLSNESIEDIRTRLADIIKHQDETSPRNNEDHALRVCGWVQDNTNVIAKCFLPFPNDLDPTGSFRPEWFARSGWSKAGERSNLLRAVLCLEAMLVGPFEEILKEDDEHRIARKLVMLHLQRAHLVEDLSRPLYQDRWPDIPNAIAEKDEEIKKTKQSNAIRNELLEDSELNPDDISKLLILAEYTGVDDAGVIEALRIVLQKIRGIVLYKGAESKTTLPGWAEEDTGRPSEIPVTRKKPWYELIDDLQLSNFVPDICDSISVMVQLEDRSPAEIRVSECLPLTREALKDMMLNRAKCIASLQRFIIHNAPNLALFLEIKTVEPGEAVAVLGKKNVKSRKEVVANERGYSYRHRLHDYGELAQPLGVLTWVDALLDPFRDDIVAEDSDVLLPKMRSACAKRDAVITTELEGRYYEIRKDNPEAKTTETDAVDAANKTFLAEAKIIQNSNSQCSGLIQATNFQSRHQNVLQELLYFSEITANPCLDTSLMKEVQDTLQRICRTLFFKDNS